MNDGDRSKDELLAELVELRRSRDAQNAQLASLRRSEQLMRLHVDQTPLGVIQWDLDLCVVTWNPAAERIFGYARAEALGRHFAFIVPGPIRHQVDTIWLALRAQKGGERSTNENVTKDGRTILCEWYNTPLIDADGLVVGFASLVMDITEQTQAFSKLRQSERRLATVISNLPGAVYRCRADAQWTIEFLSDGYRTLTGYDPATLIGQSGERHSEIIHPDDRLSELEALRQALDEKRHYQVEYRLRTATGEEKWVWEQGTGVFTENGELEAIEGFTTDVTDRKRAEAVIQASHSQLEERVRERTASLEEANARLQRERQALHRMVQAGDHERRLITYEIHDGAAQQLAGAILNLHSFELRPDVQAVVTDKVFRDALTALQRASAELRMMMSRLRTPVLDNFGLVEAIDDMTAQWSDIPLAPAVAYEHAVQFQRLEPTLENSLFRIAQEAVANACRHSRSETVRVRLIQRGDRGTLEVRDWGCGFDEKTVPESHFGLEGIRERARLLGGKLRIRSHAGQGTLIRLIFPVIER